jgi:hypothetical protein
LAAGAELLDSSAAVWVRLSAACVRKVLLAREPDAKGMVGNKTSWQLQIWLLIFLLLMLVILEMRVGMGRALQLPSPISLNAVADQRLRPLSQTAQSFRTQGTGNTPGQDQHPLLKRLCGL